MSLQRGPRRSGVSTRLDKVSPSDDRALSSALHGLALQLTAAGLTLVARSVGSSTLTRWVRIGYQRGTDSTTSYDPSR